MRHLLFAGILAASSVFICGAASAGTTTLDNSPSCCGSINYFGSPDTLTYGEVFTAPVTGTLTAFTLWLNGGVGSLEGAVGTWNGGATYATGFGSPSTLYTSSPVSSSGAQAFTFNPDISVVAGTQYVAFLSVYGVGGANGETTMPTSNNAVSGLDYFVYNNTSSPYGNTAWNYLGYSPSDLLNFNDGANAQFAATFSTGLPEPISISLFGAGLVGAAMLRRRKKA